MFRKKQDHQQIERAIGYQFRDEKILLQALTRKSAINEGIQVHSIGHFQRLEFIGDRVLSMVVSDMLFEYHPKWNEGQLTKALSDFTNNSGPLAEVAERLKLGEYLIVGRGEEKQSVRGSTKVLSDAFEALVGAIWVDSNHDYDFMKDFLEEQFEPLGLVYFNREYEKLTMELGAKKLAWEIADVINDLTPELSEFGGGLFGGGGGMTPTELAFYGAKCRNLERARQGATKPLSGVAASMERFLLESPPSYESPTEDFDDDTFDLGDPSSSSSSSSSSSGYPSNFVDPDRDTDISIPPGFFGNS